MTSSQKLLVQMTAIIRDQQELLEKQDDLLQEQRRFMDRMTQKKVKA